MKSLIALAKAELTSRSVEERGRQSVVVEEAIQSYSNSDEDVALQMKSKINPPGRDVIPSTSRPLQKGISESLALDLDIAFGGRCDTWTLIDSHPYVDKSTGYTTIQGKPKVIEGTSLLISAFFEVGKDESGIHQVARVPSTELTDEMKVKIIHGRAINKDRDQHKQKTNKRKEIESADEVANRSKIQHKRQKNIDDANFFSQRPIGVSDAEHANIVKQLGASKNYRVEETPDTIFVGAWAIEGDNNTSFVLVKSPPQREQTRLTKAASIYRVLADRTIQKHANGEVTVWAARRKGLSPKR